MNDDPNPGAHGAAYTQGRALTPVSRAFLLLFAPKLHRFLFPVFLLLTIVVSVVPVQAPTSVGYSDKVAHIFVYGVLQASAMFAFTGWKTHLLCALGITAFGVGLELVQAMLPFRDGGWADAVANTVGVSAAWFVISAWRQLALHRRIFGA